MATDFYTRSADGRFQIMLETDRLEHYVFMQEAARICVDAKPADFEPVVHSEWVRFKLPSGTHGLKCKNCKRLSGQKTVRCPNCGARMD